MHLMHPPAHPADQIYGGSRQDVLYRCALLSKAALEAPRLLPGGEAGALGEGCLFVANDFHAALVPVYLQVRGAWEGDCCSRSQGISCWLGAGCWVCLHCADARSCWPGSCPPLRHCLASHLATCASLLLLQAHYRDHGQMLYARSLLVVHNLAHQGRLGHSLHPLQIDAGPWAALWLAPALPAPSCQLSRPPTLLPTPFYRQGGARPRSLACWTCPMSTTSCSGGWTGFSSFELSSKLRVGWRVLPAVQVCAVPASCSGG